MTTQFFLCVLLSRVSSRLVAASSIVCKGASLVLPCHTLYFAAAALPPPRTHILNTHPPRTIHPFSSIRATSAPLTHTQQHRQPPPTNYHVAQHLAVALGAALAEALAALAASGHGLLGGGGGVCGVSVWVGRQAWMGETVAGVLLLGRW